MSEVYRGEPFLLSLKNTEFVRHGSRHKILEVLRSMLCDETRVVVVKVWTDEDFDAFSDYWGE